MFEGQTSVITGAGSGIGRALAQQLAVTGARLALSDVNAAALDETVAFVRNSARPWIDAGVARASDDPLTIYHIGQLDSRLAAADAAGGERERHQHHERRGPRAAGRGPRPVPHDRCRRWPSCMRCRMRSRRSWSSR